MMNILIDDIKGTGKKRLRQGLPPLLIEALTTGS
jgi:hypothetical protein